MFGSCFFVSGVLLTGPEGNPEAAAARCPSAALCLLRHTLLLLPAPLSFGVTAALRSQSRSFVSLPQPRAQGAPCFARRHWLSLPLSVDLLPPFSTVITSEDWPGDRRPAFIEQSLLLLVIPPPLPPVFLRKIQRKCSEGSGLLCELQRHVNKQRLAGCRVCRGLASLGVAATFCK